MSRMARMARMSVVLPEAILYARRSPAAGAAVTSLLFLDRNTAPATDSGDRSLARSEGHLRSSCLLKFSKHGLVMPCRLQSDTQLVTLVRISDKILATQVVCPLPECSYKTTTKFLVSTYQHLSSQSYSSTRVSNIVDVQHERGAHAKYSWLSKCDS